MENRNDKRWGSAKNVYVNVFFKKYCIYRMLFLNISTDEVIINISDQEIFLKRNDVEKKLWPTLVDLQKKYWFHDIFIINGPWWFTNLRVGTLCVNLLSSLLNHTFQIYNISKIELFKRLYQQNFLPRDGIVYIWQKKNIRHYDFKKWEYKQITRDEIPEKRDIFFDQVEELNYFPAKNQIILSWKNDKLIVKYQQKKTKITLGDLDLQPSSIVQANYFIQPIMW